jgi:DNA primase
LEVCLSQHLDIKLAFVPQGKDPCDFVLTAGKEGLDQVVAQATDVLQFRWDRLRETFAADDTVATRKGAVEEFLQAVAIGFGSDNLPVLESGLIVNKLAKMIGLPEAEIRRELGRRIRPLSEPAHNGRTPDGLPATDWGEGLFAVAQREILEVLLNEPGLFHRAEPGVSPDLFDAPVLAQIAAMVFEVIRSEEDYSLSRVLARAESVQIGERIVELQRVGEEKGNYASRFADALKVLRGRQDSSGDIRTSGPVLGVNSALPAGGSPGRQHPHSIGIT